MLSSIVILPLLFYGLRADTKPLKSEELLESAEKGSKIDQYKLSVKLQRSEDIEDSLFWLKRSAQQGYARAERSLGLLYLKGIYVEQDYGVAREWIVKVVKNGDIEAPGLLGEIFHKGLGVKIDKVRASRYFGLGIKRGDGLSFGYLGQYFQIGTVFEVDYEKSMKMYELGAKKGNIQSIFGLGYLHLKGLGTEENEVLAMTYFVTAAEKGFVPALYQLGHIYGVHARNENQIDKAIKALKKPAEYNYLNSREMLKRLEVIKIVASDLSR